MIILLIALQIILFIMFFSFFLGLVEKDRYSFRKYLTDICKKENIYIHYCYDTEELNKTVYGSDVTIHEKASGTYCYCVNYTPIENFSKKYPRIYITKKPCNYGLNSLNQTINVMTFAHEVGHHFAIKSGDKSERGADRYAVKLFKEFFPKYKSIIYFGLLTHYLNRNKND